MGDGSCHHHHHVACHDTYNITYTCIFRYRSKKKAFDRYAARVAESGNKDIATELARIKKYAQVVRVLAHTQIRKVKLRQKKAHLMEIQVRTTRMS